MPYTFYIFQCQCPESFYQLALCHLHQGKGCGEEIFKGSEGQRLCLQGSPTLSPFVLLTFGRLQVLKVLTNYRERPECSWPRPPFSSVTSSLPASDSCWLPAPRVGHREPHSHGLRTHPSTTAEREQAPNACLLLSMSGMTINLLGQVHSDT